MNVAVVSAALNPTDYVKATKVKTQGIKQFKEIFKIVDVIVMPTTAIPAIKIQTGAETHGVSDLRQSAEAMKYSCNICSQDLI